MTELQKKQIAKMRNIGLGYAVIASKMGLTKDQVSAYCRRNGLAGFKSKEKKDFDGDFCRNCGKPLIQIPGMKKRKFCSTECRIGWWNSHPERVNHKAIYSFICLYCGMEFTAYGNAHRKYCSLECSCAARFGHA